MTHEATNFAFGNRSRTEQGFLKFGFLSKKLHFCPSSLNCFFQWIILFLVFFLLLVAYTTFLQHFYHSLFFLYDALFFSLPTPRFLFFLSPLFFRSYLNHDVLYFFFFTYTSFFYFFPISSFFVPRVLSSSLTTLFLFYPIFIFLFQIFHSTLHLSQRSPVTRVKTLNLFPVDENRLEQCCAAPHEQCCQQHVAHC